MAYSQPAQDPLGTDLRLDSSGDLVSTISGSVDLVRLQDNVAQAVRIRLQTTPSSYQWGPEVGTRLAEYVDEPLTDSLKREIRNLVIEQVERDPRILGVQEVTVDEVRPEWLSVNVNAVVSGIGAVQLPIRIGR